MPQTVSVESADGPMGLYDAEPEGAARAAVMVIQEAFGVNDHIEDVCRRLSAEGYRAVAPHLFHRTGDPILGYGDIAQVMPHIQGMSASGLESDLDATLAYLADVGFEGTRVGVVGFCMGGTIAFLAATLQALGAAVTFYGGGITEGRFGMRPMVELVTELKAPWLGLYGDRDQGIPVDQVEALCKAVEAADVPTEIVRYPDADHGFHCDARDSYHEQSAKDAWQRTLRWFDTYLVGR